MHLTSGSGDFEPTHPNDFQFYRIIDVRNPSKPVEVGRWHYPGTHKGDKEAPPPRHPKFDGGYRPHNILVYPERPDRAYVAYLDGGMLTGSARMLKPWGVSKIYAIDDPNYQGVFRTAPEKLAPIVETAVENGLQFTAHSVGDGAVHALIDAYEKASEKQPASKTRCCITHSNFMSAQAIERMAKLGIVADIQPAWLYLDAATLHAQFGLERLRYFQPLKSCFEKGVIVGGGSDHMQKIGSLRSINPYNPWLGMWTTIARSPRHFQGAFHPEEALSREQAIRYYTINNAYITFREHVTGSLEKGKLADLIVIDRDILTCKVDDIRDTQVIRTYLQGKLVHEPK